MSEQKGTRNLEKIQQRFLDCLNQNISIVAPLKKILEHDMYTVLDLCFGSFAIQDERFYVALCPFYAEIEEFLPNVRIKVDKFYARIYQLSNGNEDVLQCILEKHYSSMWIVLFGLRCKIDMVKHHTPYFSRIINLPPFLDMYAEKKQWNILVAASRMGFGHAVFLLVKNRRIVAAANGCLGMLDFDVHSDILEKVAGWSGPLFDNIVIEIFKQEPENIPEALSFYEDRYKVRPKI